MKSGNKNKPILLRRNIYDKENFMFSNGGYDACRNNGVCLRNK